MRGRRYLALAAVATALAAGGTASALERRAVIELFTSQGCSSCPPADRLLAELSKDPSLIPLSLPIDYWDYLGWKDTLALSGNANRQKAYSHVRGDRDVYTPQAVINGAAQALGSDRTAIEQAITRSRSNADTMSLPVAMRVANGRLTVEAPAATSDIGNAEVWLCPLSTSIDVSIGRGENGGHTFTYHNVVRRWMKLGEWKGEAATWSIPLAEVSADGADAAAVMVQSGIGSAPGRMLGAAMIGLDGHGKTATLPNP
jgi:hypothetical protein